MKILRLIASINPADGGTVEYLLKSTDQLLHLGHDVDIASLDAPRSPWLSVDKKNVYALGDSDSTYGFSKRFSRWLKENVKNYDVVIIEGIWQYHTLAGASVCRDLNVPYFVFTHGMLDPWFRKAFPLKHLKKLAYWIIFLRNVLKHAESVLFTTEEEKLLSRESFPFYQCRETIVNIGTADNASELPSKRSVFLQKYPVLDNKKFFLFLSRIHPKKGVDILIEAFAKAAKNNPDHYLVIAGPDETGWQKELEILAEKNGVKERLIFTGMLQGDLKWGAFAAADCFVLPSHQENFGIAVAEALSASLPVLITDKVNIYREVVDAGAGLASADNTGCFSTIMQQWLGMTDAEKQKMRANARQCFVEHFEITNAAKSLEQVLKNATA